MKVDDSFKTKSFFVVMDCLITQISSRFEGSRRISTIISFLLDFEMDLEIKRKAPADLVDFYKSDLTLDFLDQFYLLRTSAPILLKHGESFIAALDLLNAIFYFNLENLMPEICVALRVFLCFFVTVAEGDRSFNKLGMIKSAFRSTIGQNRLNGLALLSIESELACAINYDDVIDAFAKNAARKNR